LEIVYVDDGSGDGSREILRKFVDEEDGIVVAKLSRNFGSFNAILAGLSLARGDCIAVISADLQDPPDRIVELYDCWERGDQIVMATRAARQDSFVSRTIARLAQSMIRRWALSNMPKGGFDFVLIDRKVRDILVDLGERNTSLMGLIVWLGFRQSTIEYVRRERPAGRSRWTFWKKFKYFVDSILAFSYAPIRSMSLVGVILALIGFVYGLTLVILKLTRGIDVPGWTTLSVIVLFLFGFQFLFMGMMGEYLWRTLDETRHRPAYIIDEVVQKSSESGVPSGDTQ
jgi:dolichol-phosphate mannosyltransferase